MSANRSRKARQLASALTERTGVAVTLDYRDSAHHAGRAWHIEWTDGPTWRQMHQLAASMADTVPALDLGQMQTVRRHTARSEAVSVLAWLDANDTNVDNWPGTWQAFALDAISYPARLRGVWLRRADALLSLTAGRLDAESCAALEAQVSAVGWAGTIDWLDGLAAGERKLRAVR